MAENSESIAFLERIIHMIITISETCNDVSLAAILVVVKRMLLLIEIMVPILLIIYSTFEFYKLVKNPDEKNGIKKIINKFIAAIVVFMIPVLINVAMNIVGEKTNFSSCWINAKEVNLSGTKYISTQEKGKKKIIYSSDGYQKGENSNPTTNNLPFDLEHAFKVHDNIHRKENKDLPWHGKKVGYYGGDIGAYTEAINILNNTDLRIYEVYNVIVSKHPEHKTKNIRVSKNEDINQYFNIKVSFIESTVSNIKSALLAGKLVHGGSNNNKWRNSKGEHVEWKGVHNGLFFYYDGSYYHMKAAGSINQSDAIYTEKQLQEWLDGSNGKSIVYEKRQ